MGGQVRSLQPAEVASLLRCPSCHSALEARAQEYSCTVCGSKFPVVRGIVRFVNADNYARNFGVQWEQFSRTQLRPEVSERNFRRKTGLREEDLRGKLVLDVGCGMGRFADVATRWGAQVIGVDLSVAAEVAARNLADRDFLAFQADVFALPFAPETFDCIYSVGVLHHTPDCEKAFKSLLPYLKSGGSIAVWLYSGYNKWYRFSDVYRRVTSRMSYRTLNTFFRLAVPCLYWLDCGLRALPLIGPPAAGLVHHVFPVNRNPDPEIRLLDTLDWYSPQYQSKHTYEQVFRWFESCGLENLTVADVSIGVRGRKPMSRSLDTSREGQRTIFETHLTRNPAPTARQAVSRSARKKGFSVGKKVARSSRWLPSYAWQRVTRGAPKGPVHLIIALADHFEPAIVPHDGSARAPYHVQEQRLERWSLDYPLLFDSWRDHDGRAFVHTYFYPAEQYDRGLLDRLANHCQEGWGEVEVHLHHGARTPDTEGNTRLRLLEFRDTLAAQHRCLSYFDGIGTPRYAFVHGNFALANSAGGVHCGVDSEIQVLADTGCYADFTLPPGLYHRAHIPKINSLYECIPPLRRPRAHRRGHDLRVGRPPQIFPLVVEGPLMLGFARPDGSRTLRVENGSLTWNNPPTMYRLGLWKQANIHVHGRPDWLFVKLQCHGMDPRDHDVMLGGAICRFLRELVEGAEARSEILHFVTAREMANMMLAACDGRDGNPGEYCDYRLKRLPTASLPSAPTEDSASLVLRR
jgi:SAM-dependent methyltransferase